VPKGLNMFEGKACGIPHLAKHERDVGHPAIGEGIDSKARDDFLPFNDPRV
jgi:hypothetical protein